MASKLDVSDLPDSAVRRDVGKVAGMQLPCGAGRPLCGRQQPVQNEHKPAQQPACLHVAIFSPFRQRFGCIARIMEVCGLRRYYLSMPCGGCPAEPLARIVAMYIAKFAPTAGDMMYAVSAFVLQGTTAC